jgi:hypothetical protein
MSEEAELKSKLVRRDKECHCILTKGILHQEDMIVSIYAPKIKAITFIKQTLLDI